MPKKRKTRLNRPLVIENDQVVSLYFDARGVQSTMLRRDPFGLALGYTRTMMGFLLFRPTPRRISMIGLGGGSLAKYCYRHLPSTAITAVEINPKVIALRDRFQLPPDDERFRVVCADGAQYVNLPDHRPDVLLVDGFNADGLPAELGSRSFYEACRRRLSDDGMLVANLVTDEPDFHRYLRSLREVFGNTVTLAPSEASEHNVTVFAWKGVDGVPSLMTMFDRARALAHGHAVNLHATATRIEYGKQFNWNRYDQVG
ncbi:fused MFS/spermidine synthase [Paraburkholderia sp. SIMBA_049]|jgi:spermidine synthase|uniref:fused MFS/spermidine synthase n=2 Tax=Paraburkholderia hospita TaxID=169430 RepID=UPI0006866F24|nr:fused MFS/spermidine synthase [Paraburkholderia hospita]SKC54854.1 Spermidine synthase [Paraburkholderia hospita]SKD04570.1 Spermidine synthase [Paraburkholderia hospita]